jgi:putative hemolysin
MMTRIKTKLTRSQRAAVRKQFRVGRLIGMLHTGKWAYQPHDFDASFELWSAPFDTRREAMEAAHEEMSHPAGFPGEEA